uniref:Uncharacterized protein n=1 Tax=Helianthus annuus TaxID=4232 RepID=A0A251SVV6_HELAN
MLNLSFGSYFSVRVNDEELHTHPNSGNRRTLLCRFILVWIHVRQRNFPEGIR